MDGLIKLRGFIPFILIIFLNAFVDLGHKILIQNTLFKAYDGQTQIILSAIVNALILLPFVLLVSPSGFLADKFRKPRVMQASAAAAVGLTLLITLSYYLGWFKLPFMLTFLLAVQSTFYSPAKYGYIKELVGKTLLAQANAAVQAVTIVAFGKPMPIHATAVEVKGRVFELSIDAWEQHTRSLDPLALAWLKTARKSAGSAAVAEARGSQMLSSRRFMAGVFAFARLMKKRSPEQNLGLLLPTSTAGLMTNMATLLLGKTVVNLNYTASMEALQSSLNKAEIESIYTSRQFIRKLKGRGMDMQPCLPMWMSIIWRILQKKSAQPESSGCCFAPLYCRRTCCMSVMANVYLSKRLPPSCFPVAAKASLRVWY